MSLGDARPSTRRHRRTLELEQAHGTDREGRKEQLISTAHKLQQDDPDVSVGEHGIKRS